jgi:cytochrome c
MKAILALAAGVLLAVGAVQAQDVLKDKGCVKCHDAEKKKMGPAIKDIAAKHKGNKDAEAAMVAKVRDGKGHPKSKESEADIKAAVQQMLK